MSTYTDVHPRELVPGLWWLGDCLGQPYHTHRLHTYNSEYLVVGERGAVLVEAGSPQDLPVIERQLQSLLDRGIELLHIWCTHQETPHASGIGRLLSRHPKATLRGEIRDYHLFFPEFEDRFEPLETGESIDLGDTELVVVDAIIRDIETTRWAFDTARRTLFPGDGFAYSHYHAEGQCGKVAEEVPELPVADLTAVFAELALYWTRLSDIEPHVQLLEQLVADLDVQTVCPSHGLPILDVAQSFPKVLQGLRLGSTGALSSEAQRDTRETPVTSLL
jgi:flavorubredoxin